MPTPLASLARSFATNTHIARQITTNFGEEHWLFRVGEASNAYWTLGHLVGYRHRLLTALGQPSEPPTWWEGTFAGGTTPPATLDPPAEDLLADFTATGELLVARLSEVDDATADADCGREMPNGSRTVEGMAHFLYFHEAYHIGQISLLARAQNLPTLGR